MNAQLRIARPVSALDASVMMYSRGLDLTVLDRFENHAGFDGAMLGAPDLPYHFEFTFCRTHPVAPTPTVEDLIVFYVRSATEWNRACESMLGAGFSEVPAFNPYWRQHGRTFADHDGYRVVLQQAEWIVHD